MKSIRIAMLIVVAALAGGQLAGCAGDANTRSTSQTMDDGYISTKVKTAILADEGLKGNQVKVETYRGVVQLSGFVDNAEQASRAVSIAQGVEGVKSVKNDVRVKPAEDTTGATSTDQSGVTSTDQSGAASTDQSDTGTPGTSNQ
jgi:hypothetical protein